jgi:hypothetical protein
MVDHLRWLLNRHSLLLLFNALHQLLSIRILAGHDVTNAQVCEDDCSDTQKVVHLSTNEGFVVANGVSEFVVLHKEDMRNVELPGLVLAAEFS